MKNYKTALAQYAAIALSGITSVFRSNEVAISPYDNDYSTPGVRKYSPSERAERKRANRQKRHAMKMKRGYA
jgi:hypothetical protein